MDTWVLGRKTEGEPTFPTYIKACNFHKGIDPANLEIMGLTSQNQNRDFACHLVTGSFRFWALWTHTFTERRRGSA